MLKLVIFLSTVACALSASISEYSSRIVNGANATISFYPWQVAILHKGQQYCGGSIYNNNIIITAAHCLKYVPASFLKVRIGSSKWNSGGTLIQVASYKYHEGFNSITMENDIGVIRLKSSIKYSSTVQNIDLVWWAPDHGADAVTTGWGRTENKRNSETLQYVNVKIVGRSQCSSQSYWYGWKIKKSMICAAAPGKDSCKGDSGGPLVYDGLLAGVTSWGTGCASANYPGVYADVAYFRSWIINAAYSV